ncbi:unnamed protein product [Rotaria sp. Silwood1]|nr:unnamed protein product [Rotaria sp. Silwood1]CAF1482534.1 unnamed protein product [Rotaria sp. Silwood1]
MSDADSTDALRCRCSTNNVGENLNINGYNECGSICATNLPTDYYTSTSPISMSSVSIQLLFYGRSSSDHCLTPPIIISVRSNLAYIGTQISLLTNETVIAQVNSPYKTLINFTTSLPVGVTKSAIINSSTVAVNRLGRNGTWIYFNDATMDNTVVLKYDCGLSLNPLGTTTPVPNLTTTSSTTYITTYNVF